MPTICSRFFFPMAISKSVNVAENMLLVCGGEAERGRKHAQPEQQSLLWGGSWSFHPLAPVVSPEAPGRESASPFIFSPSPTITFSNGSGLLWPEM